MIYESKKLQGGLYFACLSDYPIIFLILFALFVPVKYSCEIHIINLQLDYHNTTIYYMSGEDSVETCRFKSIIYHVYTLCTCSPQKYNFQDVCHHGLVAGLCVQLIPYQVVTVHT